MDWISVLAGLSRISAGSVNQKGGFRPLFFNRIQVLALVSEWASLLVAVQVYLPELVAFQQMRRTA